jgi:tol-pal system-associated acyl-CoA thioesterase
MPRMNAPADIPTSPPSSFACKVYYEDTDCMGVVYHANYLRYLERARSEFLAAYGTSVQQYEAQDVLFVVYRMELVFKAPARLGDELTVVSQARLTSPYRGTFDQRVECAARNGKMPLVTAEVELVCIGRDGSLKPVPKLGF